MRNIPDFTCEHGVATLILREIPVKEEAYCLVRWAQPGEEPALLEQCRRFCRMAGAQRVYATGVELSQEPAFRILRMTAPRPAEQDQSLCLWPLLGENWETYRRLYNEAMVSVSGARLLEDRDKDRMLQAGGAYFVHRDEKLLGLGQVEGNKLLSLVSCVPGAGQQVATALLHVISEDVAELRVADNNERACRLYRRMGFVPVGIEETWYEL